MKNKGERIGFIVTHLHGVMHWGEGFQRKPREGALWLSGGATVFQTRARAKSAIKRSIRSRTAWLKTLPNAQCSTDDFTNQSNFHIVAAEWIKP
jgi:hypothetical protein